MIAGVGFEDGGRGNTEKEARFLGSHASGSSHVATPRERFGDRFTSSMVGLWSLTMTKLQPRWLAGLNVPLIL